MLGLSAGWVGLIGGVLVAAVLAWALGRSAARADELNERVLREQRARERDEYGGRGELDELETLEREIRQERER